ncbi:amidohydrolase [Aureococcus anophagefferens]|uniref:Amidohydrolase n=2 Tax=Aureococcus anophagefferens TaxID=44056 RepID=A0ABR1G7Y8_AURAN
MGSLPWVREGAPLESYDDAPCFALRSSRVVPARPAGGFEVAAATVVVRGGAIVAVHRGDEALPADWVRRGHARAAAGGIATTLDLPSRDAGEAEANDVEARAAIAAAEGVHADAALAPAPFAAGRFLRPAAKRRALQVHRRRGGARWSLAAAPEPPPPPEEEDAEVAWTVGTPPTRSAFLSGPAARWLLASPTREESHFPDRGDPNAPWSPSLLDKLLGYMPTPSAFVCVGQKHDGDGLRPGDRARSRSEPFPLDDAPSRPLETSAPVAIPGDAPAPQKARRKKPPPLDTSRSPTPPAAAPAASSDCLGGLRSPSPPRLDAFRSPNRGASASSARATFDFPPQRPVAAAPARPGRRRPASIKIFKENDRHTRRAIRKERLYCDGRRRRRAPTAWAWCSTRRGGGGRARAAGRDVAPLKLHVAHVSTQQTATLLAEARALASNTTLGALGGSATAVHLVVAEEKVPQKATVYKVDPPIRHEAHRLALWGALRDGTLSVVTSGHAPRPPSSKMLATGDFVRAAAGTLAGANQLLLPALWAAAKHEGFGLGDVARWLAAEPARLLGLDRKGAIAVGNDADFVVFADGAPGGYDVLHGERGPPEQLPNTRRKPVTCVYQGADLLGDVRATVVRGRLAFLDGRFRDTGVGAVLEQ